MDIERWLGESRTSNLPLFLSHKRNYSWNHREISGNLSQRRHWCQHWRVPRGQRRRDHAPHSDGVALARVGAQPTHRPRGQGQGFFSGQVSCCKFPNFWSCKFRIWRLRTNPYIKQVTFWIHQQLSNFVQLCKMCLRSPCTSISASSDVLAVQGLLRQILHYVYPFSTATEGSRKLNKRASRLTSTLTKSKRRRNQRSFQVHSRDWADFSAFMNLMRRGYLTLTTWLHILIWNTSCNFLKRSLQLSQLQLVQLYF